MATTAHRISARLRPLRLAIFVSGIAPWLPVEKVFMTQLGFTPSLVATMAAAYAAIVPLLEIPSGILADRWSRRGVLMLAGGAGLASVVVGALSTGVATYIASAMVLGVYFALQSGTVDAIVYDTLLEEAGRADDYEKYFGRMQAWNSAALTGSALVGGLIAGLASPRLTYVLTVPFAAAGIVLLLRFREPKLHRRAGRTGTRAQLAATWRAVAGQPRVAAVAVAGVLAAATLQMMFEFGPLWLVAAGVATAVFGPYTAGMTATLGLGGMLAGRVRFERPAVAAAVALVLAGCGLTLSLGANGAVVIAGQIVLAALLATVGIYLSRLLHDATPSELRTGVASGVSTLSWLAFLPTSLLFGALSRTGGVAGAGWIVVALAAGVGATLIALAGRSERPAVAPCVEPIALAA